MYQDAVLIFTVGVVAFLFSSRLDLFEKAMVFSRDHESWELDELFTAMVILACCLMVFAFRRWRDLVTENRQKGIALEKNEALIADLREAIYKVERLESLVPICSNCQSIRNDKGFWQRVDSYIKDLTGASFSHSICPKCLKKLYPDYYDEVMADIGPEDIELLKDED